MIFIDVEMPELDGFRVIASLDIDRAPAVVFITAFEQYALQAFEVGAVDYLQKPVTRTRFAAAVARARERVAHRSAAHWRDIVRCASEAERTRGFRTRFVVRRGNVHHFVPVHRVEWIDVTDNYLQLHAGGRAHLARGTMKQAKDELDPARFLRVHRSAMVALDRIASVSAGEAGTYNIVMGSGAVVHCSRAFAERVCRLLR